jgi:hypothetical protein
MFVKNLPELQPTHVDEPLEEKVARGHCKYLCILSVYITCGYCMQQFSVFGCIISYFSRNSAVACLASTKFWYSGLIFTLV